MHNYVTLADDDDKGVSMSTWEVEATLDLSLRLQARNT